MYIEVHPPFPNHEMFTILLFIWSKSTETIASADIPWWPCLHVHELLEGFHIIRPLPVSEYLINLHYSALRCLIAYLPANKRQKQIVCGIMLLWLTMSWLSSFIRITNSLREHDAEGSIFEFRKRYDSITLCFN